MTDVYAISKNHLKNTGTLTDITEEDTGVSTLNMDPHVRAKLFPAVQPTKSKITTQQNSSMVSLKGNYDEQNFR